MEGNKKHIRTRKRLQNHMPQNVKVDEDGGDRKDTSGGTTSRCSTKLVHNVISKFDKKKRDIVTMIGFGGLLCFPLINKLSLKLSVWLLNRVDEVSRAIVVDQDRIYKFHECDVSKIFGIPSGGRDVRDKKLDHSNAAISSIRSRLGINNKDGRSLKAAQAILEQEYGNNMTESEVVAFKTAFIVFVMGHLLAPTAKHDYFSLDYWPALQDCSQLHSFNWGKYVIEELCDAAAKLKSDMRKKHCVSNITGCSLFLQVFYLDSIDLGILNMPHDTFPRIRAFTTERLRMMILADTVRQPNNRSDVEFGVSHPRNKKETPYFKHHQKDQLSEEDYLWKTAFSLCDLLKLPIDARSTIRNLMKEHEEKVCAKVRQLVRSLNTSFYNSIEVIAKNYDKNTNTSTVTDTTDIRVQTDQMSNTEFPPLPDLGNVTGDTTTSVWSKAAAVSGLSGCRDSGFQESQKAKKLCLNSIVGAGTSKEQRSFDSDETTLSWINSGSRSIESRLFGAHLHLAQPLADVDCGLGATEQLPSSSINAMDQW